MADHILFDNLQVGWRRTWRRAVTDQHIQQVIAATGDQGGYHVDEAFARRAGFRTVIAPGLLQAGMLTKIGGDINFLAREVRFQYLKPVYAGDTLEIVAEVQKLTPEKGLVEIAGTITNQDGVVVLTAVVVGHLPRPEWGVPTKPEPVRF